MFQVERGIPIPTTRGRKPTEFPLRDMDVSDSFLIECDAKMLGSWRRKLSGARRRYKLDSEFKSAAVEGGLRVWRVK